MLQVHSIAPVYDENSRILILGSFPSVKSREKGFFYGHPQNRFWPVLAAVFGEETPMGIPAKRALLLRHGVALWDVIAACDIEGSADAAIKNVVPNDLGALLHSADIERIYLNGGTAARLYRRFQGAVTGMDAVPLPSTSPANARWSLERLVTAWRAIT